MMNQATSRLWTRRMTNRAQDLPMLSPLYSTALAPTSAFPTDCSPTPPLRPPISSPALYTPTEAIGILLGQSPLEAAQSARLAIQEATTNLQILSPCIGSPFHSSPCSPTMDSRHLPDVTAGEEWGSYLLRSLSHHQDELKMEIDTAALATEVALQVLSPDHDYGRHNQNNKARKMRLIPVLDCNGVVSEGSPPNESQPPVGDKPVRKGRARMSQEKRKRLARRKEREAMLLGIPPKPVSAPPQITHFNSSSTMGQAPRNSYGWKQHQQQEVQWMKESRQQQQQQQQQPPVTFQGGLNRSFSGGSDSMSSRGSLSSMPSLVGDESTQSTAPIASPNSSPEYSRRSHCPLTRVGQESIWSVEDADAPVPRLSLQPPSPQHTRISEDCRHLPSSASPFRPVNVVRPSASMPAVSPPMMRWSTTEGLMTSQGIPFSALSKGLPSFPPTDMFSNNITTSAKIYDTTSNL